FACGDFTWFRSGVHKKSRDPMSTGLGSKRSGSSRTLRAVRLSADTTYCLRNGWVEIAADVDRPRRIHDHVVELRLEAGCFDFDLVRADGKRQPLEDAVEVVDDARVVTVDEDLRFTRSHLEPDVAVVDRGAVNRCRNVAVDAPVIRGAIPESGSEAEEHAERRAVAIGVAR